MWKQLALVRPQEQETHAPIIFDPRHQISDRHIQNCGKFYGRGNWSYSQLRMYICTPCAWAIVGSAGSSNGDGSNGYGRRTLLGIDAFRDRYVVFPKSAMICVACCNLIALWYSSFICIFGALPDVCCTASSIGSTAVSHIALHVLRTHAYMES